MRLFTLTIAIFFAFAGKSQEIDFGMRLQKTHKMYWETGISVGYSFKNFKPSQFYVGFEYVTSRLGSALGSNALKQDNFIINSSWYFMKEKDFRLYGRLNIGYFIADYEEEIFSELPNTAVFVAPEFGASYTFKNYPIRLQVGSGYNVEFAEDGYSPGTLQPWYYHFDVHYTLKK